MPALSVNASNKYTTQLYLEPAVNAFHVEQRQTKRHLYAESYSGRLGAASPA